MPPLLTSNAQIICSHGGRAMLVPKQMAVLAQGGSVMCEPDLIGAPITGCQQPTTSATKQCTMIAATLPGSSSLTVKVQGRPAYLGTLAGLTDGVPPGTLTVVFPGQVTVQG